jgi:hypothetical protein
MNTLENIVQAYHNALQSFQDNWIVSILSILFFGFLFSWVFWHLRHDWELRVKFFNKPGWHAMGIFDCPTAAEDYLQELINRYSIQDYFIRAIPHRRKIKQISGKKKAKLIANIHKSEIIANNDIQYFQGTRRIWRKGQNPKIKILYYDLH